jgi:hypothetical protein
MHRRMKLSWARMGRRRLSAACTAILAACLSGQAAGQVLCSESEVLEDKCLSKPGATSDVWIDAYIGRKDFSAPKFGKFLDRTYYLIEDLEWTPKVPIPGVTKIVVPKGFVTDFASVPRIFWPILPPDDEYLLAAIVHDWLYWQQLGTKPQADAYLKAGMEELGVTSWKITAVFQGVARLGDSSWKGNSDLKKSGEKRLLTEFPMSGSVRWSDWKKREPSTVR